MSPVDARVARLCAEIERDWKAVQAQLARAQSIDPHASEPAAAFVALALQHAYEAFESLLVRLEKHLGLGARAGADWHVALLADASLPLSGARPEVYPASASADWIELQRFRHFLRHAYVLTLDPDRLTQVRGRLAKAVLVTESQMAALLAALRA